MSYKNIVELPIQIHNKQYFLLIYQQFYDYKILFFLQWWHTGQYSAILHGPTFKRVYPPNQPISQPFSKTQSKSLGSSTIEGSWRKVTRLSPKPSAFNSGSSHMPGTEEVEQYETSNPQVGRSWIPVLEDNFDVG